MYIKKLEYLQQNFKQDNLYSGVTMRLLGSSLPIGTPCIINLNTSNSKKPAANLKDLHNEDKIIEDKIKSYFKNETASANILFLFNIYCESPDIVIINNKVSKICYIDDKPLIYDSYRSTFSKSSKKDVIDDSIFEQLKDQLKGSRFVNHVFKNVKSSNVNNVISNIDKIVAALVKNYKNTVSFYYYPFSGSRVLIDTVSLSFYKMKDVIPVFNYRKSEGICMEIMMTNSNIKGESLIRKGNSMTYRLLFAKYSENIFSIDGEPVKRPNDTDIATVLASSYRLLKKSTPKDVVKSYPDQSVKKEPKKAVKVKKLDMTKEFIYRGNEIYRVGEL